MSAAQEMLYTREGDSFQCECWDSSAGHEMIKNESLFFSGLNIHVFIDQKVNNTFMSVREMLSQSQEGSSLA